MIVDCKKFIPVFLIIGIVFTSCEIDQEEPYADPVEKFLGEWKCEETSEVYGPGYNYDVIITRNPENSTEIVIANFYMQGMRETAIALVTGNSMTIYEQKICDDTIIIEGSGRYEKGEIHLTYTANDGADLDNVMARYYKD